MKYDNDAAKKTTSATCSLLEYHPTRDTVCSPQNTTPENYKDILEQLDEIDEKIYEYGFRFYTDLYHLINTGGLPATGYYMPCLPLSPSVSKNFDITIDNPENKDLMNEINFVFDPTSPQISLHTNNKDKPKSKITHIKMNPGELKDSPG